MRNQNFQDFGEHPREPETEVSRTVTLPLSSAGPVPQPGEPTAAADPARAPEIAHMDRLKPVLARVLKGGAIGARYGAFVLAGWLVAMIVLIAAFTFIAPPGSALMAIRWMGGTTIDQRWVAIEDISPNLVRAVIVSEDGRFCRHWGIDPKEIVAAIRRTRKGKPRGASTITMQLAKNLFLWPSKSYVRKALEVPLVFTMELFWTKRRILEVYLNVVEWGPGVFGAQAAARHHFGINAKRLSAQQASLLAVSLPNPIRRRASAPSRHIKRVARVVRKRMKRSRWAAACVLRGH